MNGVMPLTTTATELQRNYKKVVKRVRRSREPVTVLSNNKPEVVIMDYEVFKSLSNNFVKREAVRRRSLEELYGSWTEKETQEFDKIIEDAFEQVNPEGWK